MDRKPVPPELVRDLGRIIQDIGGLIGQFADLGKRSTALQEKLTKLHSSPSGPDAEATLLAEQKKLSRQWDELFKLVRPDLLRRLWVVMMRLRGDRQWPLMKERLEGIINTHFDEQISNEDDPWRFLLRVEPFLKEIHKTLQPKRVNTQGKSLKALRRSIVKIWIESANPGHEELCGILDGRKFQLPPQATWRKYDTWSQALKKAEHNVRPWLSKTLNHPQFE